MPVTSHDWQGWGLKCSTFEASTTSNSDTTTITSLDHSPEYRKRLDDDQVHELAEFFGALSTKVSELAAQDSDTPPEGVS